MTDSFKKAIGLLMFHNIPFEYHNCEYGEFLLGGCFVNHSLFNQLTLHTIWIILSVFTKQLKKL